MFYRHSGAWRDMEFKHLLFLYSWLDLKGEKNLIKGNPQKFLVYLYLLLCPDIFFNIFKSIEYFSRFTSSRNIFSCFYFWIFILLFCYEQYISLWIYKNCICSKIVIFSSKNNLYPFKMNMFSFFVLKCEISDTPIRFVWL